MKLISTATLRTALGEMDFPDINAMLDTALSLVTQPLEGLIQTSFIEGSIFDVFRIDNLSANLSRELTRVRLSRGLVKESAGVVATFHTSLTDLYSTTASDYTYHVDYVNGKIVFDTLLPKGWLKVDYTAGIPTAEGDFVEENVPDWLKQAVIVYASSIYARLVAEKNRDKDKALKSDPGAMIKVPPEVYTIIQQYIRWYPDHYSPEFTV